VYSPSSSSTSSSVCERGRSNERGRPCCEEEDEEDVDDEDEEEVLALTEDGASCSSWVEDVDDCKFAIELL
jgi:hypothetical protein